MKTRFLLVAVGLLIAANSVVADAIDDYVERRRAKENIPAISVAILKNGEVVKQKGYGLADVELNVPATQESIYQLGSITKIFTAEAIMLLERDGKLKLDDKLSKHYANIPAAWNNITIRHLVSHTSGIKNFTSLPAYRENRRKEYAREEFFEMVKDFPLEFEPGEKWNYSNTGYLLLGLVIEEVNGQTYEEFVTERIFKPVGMKTIRHNHQFQLITNRATGYRMTSNGLQRAEFVSPSQPKAAGALVGSVLDLATWDKVVATDKILPQSVRKEMWTPVITSNGRTAEYGLGWQVMTHRGHTLIGHGGSIDGFNTFYMRVPEQQLSVIVLLNTSADPNSIALGIAGHYINDFTLASTKPRPDTDPAFTAKVKECLQQLARTKDSEAITPEFRKNFANSKRRYGALKEQIEGMQKFTFVISEQPARRESKALDVPVAKINAYKLETPRGTTFYRVAVTESGKIAAFETE